MLSDRDARAHTYTYTHTTSADEVQDTEERVHEALVRIIVCQLCSHPGAAGALARTCGLPRSQCGANATEAGSRNHNIEALAGGHARGVGRCNGQEIDPPGCEEDAAVGSETAAGHSNVEVGRGGAGGEVEGGGGKGKGGEEGRGRKCGKRARTEGRAMLTADGCGGGGESEGSCRGEEEGQWGHGMSDWLNPTEEVLGAHQQCSVCGQACGVFCVCVCWCVCARVCPGACLPAALPHE